MAVDDVNLRVRGSPFDPDGDGGETTTDPPVGDSDGGGDSGCSSGCGGCGGFGRLGRRFGLTIDNVLEMDIVTPDRHLRRVSPDNEPELYWALRGGGGQRFSQPVLELVVVERQEAP